MGLDDFERELAAVQSHDRDARDTRPHGGEESKHHRHHHRHHHKSTRHDESSGKRRRRSGGRNHHDRDDRHRSKRVRSASPRPQQLGDEDEDEWVEKEGPAAPPEADSLDGRVDNDHDKLQRDSWMQAPSTLDVDYLHGNRRQKSPPSQFVTARQDHDKKIRKQEVEQVMEAFEGDEGDGEGHVADVPSQRAVDYTFGDSGSQWRMTKLKAAYRQAKEENLPIEEVALQRYGDLRDFDDAREEELELDRRKRHGDGYVGREKPSGELFRERNQTADTLCAAPRQDLAKHQSELDQGTVIPDNSRRTTSVPLDQTALNGLKAKLMKARVKKATNLPDLEAEYAAALAASNPTQSDTSILSAMDTRLLNRGNEVNAVTNSRGQQRGTMVENADMSIADMVRAERRTRNTASANEGLLLASRIAKDAKFTDDLEYMNDNAERLAKRGAKTDAQLRGSAIGDFQRQQKILDSCPLCHHEDRGDLPVAPVVSLGTRTYLTLCPEPELVANGAVIVPVQHRANLLECDDDEWEEVRNFMKSLTRWYASLGRGVIFYENAAERGGRRHAAMVAVPLRGDHVDAAPGFFKEAILQADEEWTQHRKVIDTAQGARERFGKVAFRKMMAKEMPYFHVWFGLDGGLGHIVEDERRWPKGDLFAREVVGGMLDRELGLVKKQGRWVRRDHRLEGFRKKWDQYDWTKVLVGAR